MRVHGDTNPGTLRVEDYPPKPGLSLVRFFENAQEYTREDGGHTYHGWEYDEHQLIVPRCSEEDVTIHFAEWLAEAKAKEQTPEKTLAENTQLLAVLLGVTP